MYENFFGFSRKPFQIVPNPDMLYLTEKHQTALTYLEYGLREGAGFILLTGDIGSGKTTLIRHLLRGLPQAVDAAVVFNTMVSPTELLEMVVAEFGVAAASGNRAANLELLRNFLVDKHAAGRSAVLVVDEAQNLTVEVLEEVRMLSNLHTDDRMLLQIVLVGQPELQARLRGPNLAQLAQRIAVVYHLGPLSREEAGFYVRHRLAHVGGDPDLFTDQALARVFEVTGGIPRAINIVCDTALVYAYADQLRTIDVAIVNQVVEDRGGFPLLGGVEHASDAVDAKRRLAKLEEDVHGLRVELAVARQELENFKKENWAEQLRVMADCLHREREAYRELAAKFAVAERDRPHAVSRSNTCEVVLPYHPEIAE